MTLVLPALPILVPLGAALLGIVAWRSLRAQFAIALGGSIAHMGVAGLLFYRTLIDGHVVLHVGSWRAPVGIAVVADPFGAALALMASWTGLATILHARASVDEARQRRFLFPLMSILLAGVCGAFLTGDLFNLYVWFEVLLMSSFVLLALGSARRQLQSAVTYVTLNLLSSTLFLVAAGILYGVVGTLNYAHLSVKIQEAMAQGSSPLTLVAVLLALAFSIKAALFPLAFWLPAAYPTPPVAIAGLFAGLMTKVGIIALLRLTTLIFHGQSWLNDALLVAAAVTMLMGGLGTICQNEIRRTLAFSSVSQIGYACMGLAIGTPAAIAAALLFILHHNLVKTNQFLLVHLVERVRGTTALNQPGIRGVYSKAPFLSLVFLITALSLAGIPPLSGFVAKLALVRAGLEGREFWVIAIAMLSSMCTLFAMARIWSEVFWREHKPAEGEAPAPKLPRAPRAWMMGVSSGFLLLAGISLGIFAGPAWNLCQRAAAVMLDRDAYVHAVLGDTMPTPTPTPIPTPTPPAIDAHASATEAHP